MKRWVLGGVLLLGAAAIAVVVPFNLHDVRSVRRIEEEPQSASTHFDPRQSAALFVGVREFTSAEPVRFAIDDAIDLAYVFALGRHVRLVPPGRVVVVLSGRPPVKPESRARLRALRENGADIRYGADAAAIAAALREQTRLAGRDGLLVVSIAAHGLLRDGNGYVLGTSSMVHDTSTMLSVTEMLETIASSRAQRSLVFIDACRERLQSGTRSVLAGVMSSAPLLPGLNRRRGQAVFYAAAAGKVAYDDPIARNGVFTSAVIDGLKCGAPKNHDCVTADTLAGHVERYVKTWIREHRDPSVGSATQSSIDGDARNMPLVRCGGPPPSGPDHVTFAGTTIRAFSDRDELLWQADAGSTVVHAEAVDLDADGWCEVVYATRDSVAALDDTGKPLWTAGEPMTLRAVVSGDLYRQRTRQVVAIWNGEHSSRLSVYTADGTRRNAVDDVLRFDRVTIARASNRHAPKIVVTSGNIVLAFDPKKLASGKPLWAGRVSPGSEKIASIGVGDGDGDGKSDIALTTESGKKIFIDVSGHALSSRSGARFERFSLRRTRGSW